MVAGHISGPDAAPIPLTPARVATSSVRTGLPNYGCQRYNTWQAPVLWALRASVPQHGTAPWRSGPRPAGTGNRRGVKPAMRLRGAPSPGRIGRATRRALTLRPNQSIGADQPKQPPVGRGRCAGIRPHGMIPAGCRLFPWRGHGHIYRNAALIAWSPLHRLSKCARRGTVVRDFGALTLVDNIQMTENP